MSIEGTCVHLMAMTISPMFVSLILWKLASLRGRPWLYALLDGKDDIDLAGAGRTEVRRHHLGLAGVAFAAQDAEQHRRVVHHPFAVALRCVLRQHAAEGLPVSLFPQLDDVVIDGFQERVPDLVQELLGHAVLGEAVGQRTGGK